MKLFFATPSHKGDGQACVTWSATMARSLGVEAHISVISDCPCIDVARSTLVASFLKTDCTHLFFRDDDITFEEPSTLLRLIDQTSDIAVIPYKKRTANEWALRFDSRGFVFPGLGCCVIARHVIEHMIEHYPDLTYVDNGLTLHALFMHCFDFDGGQKLFLQEDHAFFLRAQKLGFRIRVVTGETVYHAGIACRYSSPWP